MDDDTIDRIYAGCLEKMPDIIPRIVRIFTSSTFTDMSLERNTLMEEVYPRLKAYCRDRHGLEFQVVDMRWGVRDEATDDHMTTELCMNEIRNCQRLSLGPNFVVFLGQKYGYRPIPTFIDGKEFLQVRDILTQIGADTMLLDRWYKEDTNAIPSIYILQPISSILVNFNNKSIPRLQHKDQGIWWDTLGKMQILLRRASQALYALGKIDEEAMHSYRMSVTEREVINGLLTVQDTQCHCLAYLRRIDNINMDNIKAACKFVDITNREVDKEAETLLSDLRDNRLLSKIRRPNLIKWTVDWYGRDGLDKEFHELYLKEFTSHFYKHITRLVDKAAINAKLDSLSPVVTEILQHLHACNNSISVFEGRVREIYCTKAYIEGNSDQPMILYGVGGCGKTSLLAKISNLVSSWYKSDQMPFVILRLLGITPTSSSMLSTLQSLCQQIAYNYSMHCSDMPHEYIPLVGYFKRLLTHATAHHPLCILIDSVDQLSGHNLANRVSWIPTALPEHVKMIISILVDEDDTKDFLILKKMIENEEQFIEIKALGNDLGMRVIKNWMCKTSRDLNRQQWRIVRNVVSRCNLPIFVKLVFAEISRWRSYTKLEDTVLSHTVMDSIMRLFERIEKQHGKILVSRALSYITASKSGLSEMELEDLISMDDQVLEDVYQYHLPPIRRIPPLLWTRIRSDLPKYLSEREADGITVLNWYHRQFRKAAEQRYFRNRNIKQYLHSQITDYFLGTWGGGIPKPFKYTEIQRFRFGISDKNGLADRKLPLQPMIFASVKGFKPRYNIRKFGELPFHLLRSKRYDNLFQYVLFNYDWLYHKISCCPFSSVLSDFEDAQRMIEDENYRKEISLVGDSIRLGGVTLSQYPGMIASHLIGRLVPLKGKFTHIKKLLEQCDKQGPKHCALLPAYQCLNTPGGAMKYLLEGHQFAVFGFVVTSDFRYVISVSTHLLIWDLCTGHMTHDIDPEITGIMMNVALSFDDKYAVAYSTYNLLIAFNILTGDIIKYQINSLEPNDIRGISFSGNMTVVWRKTEWTIYKTSTLQIIETNIVDNGSILVAVNLISISEYCIILSSSDIEGSDLTLKYVVNNKTTNQIEFKGGFAISKDLNRIYTCEVVDTSWKLIRYIRENDNFSSRYVMENDIGKDVLELSLNGVEDHVIAVLSDRFLTWNTEKSNFRKELKLPNNVRNIFIKVTKSQSHMVLTKGNEFGVAGIRRLIYIWKIENEKLMKVIEAHCARILNIIAVADDFSNLVISSSIDHTLKVWNIDHIFEQSYCIDRMESPIDSISLSKKSNLAVTVTRNSLGVWNTRTGKLICKLSDSPLGAIITHGCITSDGCYVVCVECENLLVWNIDKRNNLWKREHSNVCQLLLHQNDTRILSVTKDISHKATCRSISLNKGTVIFSIEFVSCLLKPVVITSNEEYLVVSFTSRYNTDILVYRASTGIEMNKITVEDEFFTDLQQLIAYPNNGKSIIAVGKEKGQVFDVSNGNHLMTISNWSGYCSNNGKYGLYTPSGGGLEVIELKHSSTIRILLPRLTEGMFDIQAGFTKSDNYVYYYHGGKETLMLFRMSDGKLIADYHLSSRAISIICDLNSTFIYIGGADGSLLALALVDPANPDSEKLLEELPSRKISNEPIVISLNRADS